MITEIRLPELGENIDSAEIIKILVTPGQSIKKDQSIIELETEKAVVEVPSSSDGIVKEILVEEGKKIESGELILTLETTDNNVVVNKETPEKGEEKIIPALPNVRRMARELNVDINNVIGTGSEGRIIKEDVEALAPQEKKREDNLSPTVTPETKQIDSIHDFSKWGEIEKKPMSNVRRKTADHMSEAWSMIPHVTNFDKADITELEEMRKGYAKKAEVLGGKLTITAIILKIVSSALKHFPQFNASIDMGKNEIIYKKYYHIGVAVETDRGLLVPVIRDLDKKNILEISVELTQTAEKARSKKTTIEEMQGSTFTITNLGGIGGTNFAPLINSPEVAVLGISRSSKEPVFINGQFEPRLMLPLSLSYDHRLIDGADAARFLRWISDALQQPFLIFLEG